MTTTTRPMLALALVSGRYPRAWKNYKGMRAAQGRDLPDWPEWCWCPLAAAYAVVSDGGTLDAAIALDVGRVGALAAWRATKGIYRYDPDVLAALWTSPIAGGIPTDALYHLPEWCGYFELGARDATGALIPRSTPLGELYGFFAHLEQMARATSSV